MCGGLLTIMTMVAIHYWVKDMQHNNELEIDEHTTTLDAETVEKTKKVNHEKV